MSLDISKSRDYAKEINGKYRQILSTSDSYVVVSVKPDGANKSAGCNIEYSEMI